MATAGSDDATVQPQYLHRSCNEALVLAALRHGPRHGYQIALDVEERAAGAFRLQHGTLYPILHRLEKRGLIRGTWSHNPAGRKRKRYALTARGRRYAARQVDSWKSFVRLFMAAVEGGTP